MWLGSHLGHESTGKSQKGKFLLGLTNGLASKVPLKDRSGIMGQTQYYLRASDRPNATIPIESIDPTTETTVFNAICKERFDLTDPGIYLLLLRNPR